MKTTGIFALTLLTTIATASHLSAQETTSTQPENGRTYQASFLPALKITADGRMTEITEPARIREIIAPEAPANGAPRREWQDFRQQVLSRFDRDRDRRLNDDERAAMRAAIDAGELQSPESLDGSQAARRSEA